MIYDSQSIPNLEPVTMDNDNRDWLGEWKAARELRAEQEYESRAPLPVLICQYATARGRCHERATSAVERPVDGRGSAVTRYYCPTHAALVQGS